MRTPRACSSTGWSVAKGSSSNIAVTFEVPVHKALQLPQFVPFADTIAGKSKSVRDDALLQSDLNKKMSAQWDRYWNASATKKTSCTAPGDRR